MAKSNNHKVEVSETMRVVLVTILFLLLALLLMSVDVVASGVSKVTGIDEETIKELPHKTFGVIAGVALIIAGLTLLPVTALGVVAIAIGVVAIGLWFKTKPENQGLGNFR